MSKYTKSSHTKPVGEEDVISSSIIQLVHDAIIVVDEDQNIILFNQGAEKTFGYAASEIIGHRLDVLLPPQAAKIHKIYMHDFAKTPNKTRLMGERQEVSGRRKDGTVFPAEASIAKVTVGKKIVFTAILRDITQRKQEQETLRLNEARFRALIENASDAIALISADGTILYESSAVTRMLGYAVNERVGRGFFELIHPNDLPDINNRFAQLLQRPGITIDTQLRVRHKDGSWCWLEGIGHNLLAEPSVQAIVANYRNITERYQAEQNLRTSEAFSRTVLDSLSAHICVLNAQGIITAVNKAWEDFGRENNDNPKIMQFVGANYLVEIERAIQRGDESAQAALEGIHEVMSGIGETFDMEYPCHAPNEQRWFVMRVRPLNDGSGGVVISHQTITERKLAQESLRLSEAKFRALIENSSDGIMLLDEKTKVTYISPAVTRMLGYVPDEFVGQNALEFIHSDDLNINLELLGLLLQKPNGHESSQMRLRHKNGSWHWVEATGTNLLQEPTVSGIVVNFRDITRRKQVEEESNKLHNAVEQSGDIIFITDRNGMIEYVNPAFETITGYSKEESLGKSPNIMSSGLMETEHYQKLWKTIMLGEVFRGEITDRKKSGEIFYYDQTITPLKDEQGNITHFVSTGKDVTERKQVEAEIRHRLGELEVLYQSGLALNQVLEPIEIAQKIINLLDEKLDWHHVTIHLYHAQDETLELLAFNQRGLKSEQEKRVLEELIRKVIVKKGQGVCGWAVEHGQSVRTADLVNDERYIETFSGLRSGLYIPIKIAERVIGVISIESEEADAFSESDERLATTLATQAAGALENARLFKETQARLKNLQSLHTIDKTITGSMDINLILDVIIGKVISELNVDAVDILLYDQTTEMLKYAKGSGFRTETFQHTRLQLGDGYAGRVAMGRQTVRIQDLQTRTTDFLRSPTFAQEGFVSYFGVPLITKGEIKGVLEVFHRAAFEVETDWLNFLEALAVQMAIAIDNATLFKDLQLSNAELSLAYDATIEGWSHAMDLRDKETEGHTLRVTKMTLQLAQAMDISKAEIISIRRGALLHDIGKMGVPDSILLKPDKLTDEEWIYMRQHPQLAFDMLSPITYLKPALDIPYCHHEKWDGTGYPQGLKGEQIPFAARIFAIADVYDALTSDRPYRKAWSKEKTLEYIRDQSGKHFDPRLVEVFLKVINYFEI